MMGLLPESGRVFVRHHASKKRKLPYSWELVEIDDGLVCIHASNANELVAEALEKNSIRELAGYDTISREKRLDDGTRLDFYLTKSGQPDCFVEVKSVTLSRAPSILEFPDSKTTRGAKHLRALSALAANGARAVSLFLAQRGDGTIFRVASDIDPAYGTALREAKMAGVETLCYNCDINLNEIAVKSAVKIEEADINE